MRAMRFPMAEESSSRPKQPTTDLLLPRSPTQASALHRRTSRRSTTRSTRPRASGREPASVSRCRMASSRSTPVVSLSTAHRATAQVSESPYRPHASAPASKRSETSHKKHKKEVQPQKHKRKVQSSAFRMLLKRQAEA